MANHLTLYRRHSRKKNEDGTFESLCARAYDQDARIFDGVLHKHDGGTLKAHEPAKKTDQRRDCNCPIVADGSLANELGRIRYRSLDTRSWEEAIAAALNKLTWGQWEEPVKAPAPLAVGYEKNLTVEEVVVLFEKAIGPTGLKFAKSTKSHYRTLLRTRLLPWCNAHNPPVRFMASFESGLLGDEFSQSWARTARWSKDPDAGQPLTDSGKFLMRNKWMMFLHWCVEKNIMTKAPKLETRAPSDGQKPSLTLEELNRVKEQAANNLTGKKGLPLQRAQDNWLAIALYEETGMRTSDVATLCDRDIVWFEEGQCYAIDREEWKLRNEEEPGRIWHPLSKKLYDHLMAHGYRGEQDDKRYFFHRGRGSLETTIKHLRNHIGNLIRQAQQPDLETGELTEPFAVHATAHTLRHTYGQLLYNRGEALDVIQELMGHKKLDTTAKFYVGKTKERKAFLVNRVLTHATDRTITPPPANVVPIDQKTA